MESSMKKLFRFILPPLNPAKLFIKPPNRFLRWIWHD
nr:MAG TPA: hypothetical protein [Caudoviricetes sp.]DAK12315.1 MAG TPA: hypothetical protein [Caudoviricetes sp.]